MPKSIPRFSGKHNPKKRAHSGVSAFKNASPAAQKRAKARQFVVEALLAARRDHPGSSEAALETILTLSQSRALQPPGLEQGFSRSTVYRWLEKYEKRGIDGLLDHYEGPRNPYVMIPPIQGGIVDLLSTDRQISAKRITEELAVRLTGQRLPCYETVRCFVARWKQENPHLYRFLLNNADRGQEEGDDA